MKKCLFEGVCTALVTPFENGSVNLTMLRKLLDRQLEAGIRTIVISGTTGESPTLTDAEKLLLFREAKRHVGDQALIIAGTGCSCTEKAAALSRAAALEGADALLVVTPYYNKATHQGLLRHYAAISQAAPIPMILYNVPSRTGMDLSPNQCRELAALSGVVGIKEASPDLRKLAHLRAVCPEDFAIWSGNDDLVLPMIALGASGVISVASNVIPGRMKAMVDLALQGSREAAEARFLALLPLLDSLFAEVNPVPVKAAMEAAGLDCGSCRLPLSEASPETRESLVRALQQLTGPAI